jgi:hypothetical protein
MSDFPAFLIGLVTIGCLAPALLLYTYLALKHHVTTFSTAVLVPIMSGIGAAYSYLTGSLAGLIVAIIIAHKIGLRIIWRAIAIALSIPTATGLLAHITNLH